jgi:hypothetical protein
MTARISPSLTPKVTPERAATPPKFNQTSATLSLKESFFSIEEGREEVECGLILLNSGSFVNMKGRVVYPQFLLCPTGVSPFRGFIRPALEANRISARDSLRTQVSLEIHASKL